MTENIVQNIRHPVVKSESLGINNSGISWYLELGCGHSFVYTRYNQFSPPKTVKCYFCEERRK